MKENDKYWFKVLSHYEKNNYFQNGLTLPFLIGSRTIVDKPNEIQSISDFVSDLIYSEHLITIMKCEQISEYVLGIMDFETKILIEGRYKGIYKEFGKLIVTDSSFDLIHNIQDLIDYFEMTFSSLIDRKLFSKTNGKWNYFDEVDKKRLNQIV